MTIDPTIIVPATFVILFFGVLGWAVFITIKPLFKELAYQWHRSTVGNKTLTIMMWMLLIAGMYYMVVSSH